MGSSWTGKYTVPLLPFVVGACVPDSWIEAWEWMIKRNTTICMEVWGCMLYLHRKETPRHRKEGSIQGIGKYFITRRERLMNTDLWPREVLRCGLHRALPPRLRLTAPSTGQRAPTPPPPPPTCPPEAASFDFSSAPRYPRDLAPGPKTCYTFSSLLFIHMYAPSKRL